MFLSNTVHTCTFMCARLLQTAQFWPIRTGTQALMCFQKFLITLHLQSFHKKPSTPKFATVTPQVTLSGDTCVKTRTVLSSNPLSMDCFAGAMFPRACTPRVTSVFKGPAGCYSTAPKLGALDDGLRDHLRVGPDLVAPLSVRQQWLSQIWFQFGEAKKLQVAAAEPARAGTSDGAADGERPRRAANGVQLGTPPQRSLFWRRWTQAHGTLLIGRGLPSTPLSLQPPPPPYGHTHPPHVIPGLPALRSLKGVGAQSPFWLMWAAHFFVEPVRMGDTVWFSPQIFVQ